MDEEKFIRIDFEDTVDNTQMKTEIHNVNAAEIAFALNRLSNTLLERLGLVDTVE